MFFCIICFSDLLVVESMCIFIFCCWLLFNILKVCFCSICSNFIWLVIGKLLILFKKIVLLFVRLKWFWWLVWVFVNVFLMWLKSLFLKSDLGILLRFIFMKVVFVCWFLVWMVFVMSFFLVLFFLVMSILVLVGVICLVIFNICSKEVFFFIICLKLSVCFFWWMLFCKFKMVLMDCSNCWFF